MFKKNKEEFILSLLIIITLIILMNNKMSRLFDFLWIFIGIYYVYKACRYKKTGLEKYFMIYFLTQGLSIIWAEEPAKSWHEYSRHLYALIPIFSLTQIPYLNKIKEKSLEISMKIVTVYYFIYITLQLTGIVEKVRNGNRYIGFGDRSVVKYAYIVGILCVYWLYNYLKYKKKEAYIGILMSLYLMVLTQARGAWLAVIITYGIMYLISSENIKVSIRNIILGSFGVGSGLFIFRNSKLIRPYYHRLMSISNTTTDRSNAARIDMWKDSWDKFNNTNYLGLGYKNNLKYNSRLGLMDHSHSDFFYILSSSGIIGILGYGYFYFGILIKSVKKVRNDMWLLILGIMVFIGVYGVVEVLIQTYIVLAVTVFILALAWKE